MAVKSRHVVYLSAEQWNDIKFAAGGRGETASEFIRNLWVTWRETPGKPHADSHLEQREASKQDEPSAPPTKPFERMKVSDGNLIGRMTQEQRNEVLRKLSK